MCSLHVKHLIPWNLNSLLCLTCNVTVNKKQNKIVDTECKFFLGSCCFYLYRHSTRQSGDHQLLAREGQIIPSLATVGSVFETPCQVWVTPGILVLVIVTFITGRQGMLSWQSCLSLVVLSWLLYWGSSSPGLGGTAEDKDWIRFNKTQENNQGFI